MKATMDRISQIVLKCNHEVSHVVEVDQSKKFCFLIITWCVYLLFTDQFWWNAFISQAQFRSSAELHRLHGGHPLQWGEHHQPSTQEKSRHIQLCKGLFWMTFFSSCVSGSSGPSHLARLMLSPDAQLAGTLVHMFASLSNVKESRSVPRVGTCHHLVSYLETIRETIRKP